MCKIIVQDFSSDPTKSKQSLGHSSSSKMVAMALVRTTPFLGTLAQFPNHKQSQLVLRRASSRLQTRSRATLDGDAAAGETSKRLVDVVRRLPRIARSYFRSPVRRALFNGIAILGGFYVAQTISLSFGALGVNDVIAAAMCVLFTEFVTRFTRSRKNVSFSIALVNTFKMGFTYGLFIDAFKLAS